MISLQHDEALQTRYTHLDTIYVQPGESVKSGQRIAGVGTTGLSTGPHLHFEVRVTDIPQDPKKYVDFSGLKALAK